LFFSNYLKLEF